MTILKRNGDLLNRKIVYTIVLVAGLAGVLAYGALAYATSHAWEEVAVSTACSGGSVAFLDNISPGVRNLGSVNTYPGSGESLSSPISLSVETGIGSNTFTATWSDTRRDGSSSGKAAVFTLTVWDPAGVPHSTSLESRRSGSGTMSVSLFSPEPGEGRFELTSTILERRLNFSALSGR